MKTEQKNNEDIYSTRDLNLASTLITLKFFMVGIDYQIEGEKPWPVAYFNFKDTIEIQEAIKKYRQGQLAVEPRLFSSNLRELKAEITNKYKNPHTNIEKVE